MCYNLCMNVEDISEFPKNAQNNCKRCDAFVNAGPSGRCKLAVFANFIGVNSLSPVAIREYLSRTSGKNNPSVQGGCYNGYSS